MKEFILVMLIFVLIGYSLYNYDIINDLQQQKLELSQALLDKDLLVIEVNKEYEVEMNESNERITTLEKDRAQLIGELTLCYEKEEELKNKYNELKEEKGITKITYREVKDFLDDDHTDRNPYTDDYVCSHFASDLISNALDNGILACGVEIRYVSNKGHKIVAFPTEDGVVLIEPQTDEEIKGLVVGSEYCRISNWVCSGEVSLIKDVVCACC